MARGARGHPPSSALLLIQRTPSGPRSAGLRNFFAVSKLMQLSRIIPNAKSRQCLGATQPSLVLIADIVLPLTWANASMKAFKTGRGAGLSDAKFAFQFGSPSAAR